MIPKHHGAKLTDIPDDSLSEILVGQPPPTNRKLMDFLTGVMRSR